MTQSPLRTSGRTLELLGRGEPRDVLARIVPGDPLGLRPRVAHRLRARALLFDAERPLLRSLALVAARAPRYRGRPRPDLWLDARVEEALDELLSEERAGVREGLGSFEQIARRLGLRCEAVAAGRRRFHALKREDRDAFLRLVLEAQPLDACARELGVTITELASRARRALFAFVAGEARP